MANDVAKASIFHEAPLEVLRLAPRLVLELLAAAHQPFDSGGAPTDGDSVEVMITDSQLSEPQPHLRAVDFVVIVRSKTHSRCVAIEVQRRRDAAKKREWPHYVILLHLRLSMPVFLVVLTFDDAVARWARRWPTQGSLSFTPLVLGPSDLGGEADDASPGIVTLQALAELGRLATPRAGADRERAEAVVVAALTKLLKMAPSPNRATFLGLIYGTASVRFQAKIDKLLEDFGMGALDLINKKLRREGRLEGLEEGLVKGLEEGLVKGREEGIEEGLVKGRADALLRVLGARRLAVSPDRRTQIEQASVDELNAWLERAALAATIEDVFDA